MTKPKKAPALDVEQIERINAKIQAEIDGPYLDDLVHRLQSECGLKLTVKKGRIHAKMVGIEANAQGSPERHQKALVNATEAKAALENWSNAARRAVIKAA